MDSIYGIERQPTFDCYCAIGEVLHDKDFILGTTVSILERKLAHFVNRKFGIAVSSGTDAQFLLMKALGIGPGDLVFVPDFTFLSTATTVKMVGAIPIFVDVDRSTFTMYFESLREKIREASVVGTPKAVVPVDLFGCMYDFVSINSLAKEYDLIVIEDGCHALGSRTGKGTYALSLGDHSFTSFYPTKPLGCFGDAGMIFTDDSDLSSKLRYMRKHNQLVKHKCDSLGYNMRMDTIQAAVLLEKFKRYKDDLKKRQVIAGRYVDGIKNVEFQNQPQHSTCALFSILCRDSEHRNKISAKLPCSEIYYPTPLHKQKVFKEDLICYSYPNSEALSDSILQIPMHQYLTDHEVTEIIETINEVE